MALPVPLPLPSSLLAVMDPLMTQWCHVACLIHGRLVSELALVEMYVVELVSLVLIPMDCPLGCIGSIGPSRCLLISLLVLPLVWLLPLPPLLDQSLPP